MDEADQILVTDLKSVGMKIEKLSQLDSNLFICSIGMIFESISKILGKDDFFDKRRLQMMMNFAEVSNKFELCQVITNYLKRLGYYDITFNNLLSPNINHIRNALVYLFDYIWKREEEAKATAGTESDYADQMGEKENFSFVLKRKLDNWTKQPWIMPEFRLETKNTFARLRNRIHLFTQKDEANIQNTK